MSASGIDSQRSRSTVTGSKWASGRQLTGPQRARKRAVDRARSKQQRLSTLKRIAELEAKLQSVLSETNLDDSEEGITTDNKAGFQRTGNHTNGDLHPHRPRSISSDEQRTAHWPMMAAFGDIVDISPQPSCWEGQYEPSSISHTNSSQKDLMYSNSSMLPGITDSTPPAPGLQLPRSIVLRRGDIPTLWISEAIRSNNESLLVAAQYARKVEVCLDDQINQDVLIRGIIEGWEVLKSRAKVCPLWEILRSIDYLLFWNASPVTRLVMLRMIHHMLLVRIAFRELRSVELTLQVQSF
jgi:hypothetical protein